ncbi:MAG: hypothetical protein LBS45_06000 [Synergistaceae bacterium]|jgi:hypothetical protein|nr:hypothetical protein [Synergistaceae bacterium]
MTYYARGGVGFIDSRFRKMKQALSELSAFLVIASFLTAALFVVLHAEHDCPGEGCAVCAQLYVVSEALKRFSSGPDFTASALAVCLFALISRLVSDKAALCARALNTPVWAKVRLNN